MIRIYRYPLLPTKTQETILVSWLESCRLLYNAALQERISYYKKYRNEIKNKSIKSISYYDQTKSLTEVRKDSEYKKIPMVAQRSALDRVDKAFKDFFSRVKRGEKKGYPRYKSFGRYDSFSLMSQVPQVHDNYIKIGSIKQLKFHKYRELKGSIKDIIIKKEPTGWSINFVCYIGEAPPKVVPVSKVGIDLGIKSFLVSSDNDVIDNPKHYKKSERQLRMRQRRLSRRKKGSKSREKAKLLVAKTHNKIKNQRLDFVRKTAKSLVDSYDMICHEDLQIKNMVKGCFSKSIHNIGWGKFLQILEYKAEEAGKIIVKVNPYGTTQDCSSCNQKVKKDISIRIHNCPHCGLKIDKD